MLLRSYSENRGRMSPRPPLYPPLLTPLTTDAGLGPKVDISGLELPEKTPEHKS